MRLIDADALVYEHTIARSTDDGHNWNELCVTKDQIDNAPTIMPKEFEPLVEAIIDVLPAIVEKTVPAIVEKIERIGEWIPITKRPMTDDEWEELPDEAKDYIDEDEKWFFDCPMPENGQNIIISTKWGVWGDTCEISAEGGLNAYYLEGQGDWDGVLAWMPMPEPYKEEKNEQSE